MCGVATKERPHRTAMKTRCRGNWRCNEKVQTQVAWTCGTQGRRRLDKGLFKVGGGEERLLLSTEEDLAEKCRHATPRNLLSGRLRLHEWRIIERLIKVKRAEYGTI